MKFLTVCITLLSFQAMAMMKKPSIDGALSHRYDENYEETHRSLASGPEKIEEDKKKEKADRVPSSKGEAFEQINENGIRYWKY